MFEINGPFFFGATEKFRSALGQIGTPPKRLVLVMEQVPAMDITGARALEEVYAQCRSHGTRLRLVGVRKQPRAVLEKTGLLDSIGTENLFPTLNDALQTQDGA